MNSELRDFISQSGLCRDSVERVAEMLPADDRELDSYIDEAVRESDSMAFMLIVYADAQAKVETLRERVQLTAVARARDAESDIEDDLPLPQDAEGSHPVRLIAFPRAFHDRLSEFPHHVARGAMVTLGVWRAVTPPHSAAQNVWKSRPNMVRQRIGIDCRLLFRLLPDRI